VSNRDFVFASRVIRIGNDFLLTARSIETELSPERSGIVRGSIDTSGFYLQQIAEGVTRVTYVVNVDPKGMLPLFLVNKLGNNQCQVVHKIRTRLGVYSNKMLCC